MSKNIIKIGNAVIKIKLRPNCKMAAVKHCLLSYFTNKQLWILPLLLILYPLYFPTPQQWARYLWQSVYLLSINVTIYCTTVYLPINNIAN